MAEVTVFEPMRRLAVRQWGEVEDETFWTIEPRGRNRCFVGVRIRRPAPAPAWLERRPLLAAILGSGEADLRRTASQKTARLRSKVEGRLAGVKRQREINRRYREKERAKAAARSASR